MAAVGAVAARLRSLGHVLPQFQEAVGTYRKCLRDGNLVYTSTHFGMDAAGVTVSGKVGDPADYSGALPVVSAEEANLLARNAGLRLLCTLDHHLDGDLDRIEQVIKIQGIVNGTPDFAGHGLVIDGCCGDFC